MQVSYGSRSHPSDYSLSTADLGPLCLPPLGEQIREQLPLAPQQYRQVSRFHLWQDRQLSLGLASVPVADKDILTLSESIYDELFELTREAYLFRIWNYIPHINSGDGDQERYRKFCAGRSQSFHNAFGENEIAYMPAGTCVGNDSDYLTILFIAADSRPDHHENPNQTPAYRYPRQYGPKSPSFARATTGTINGAHHRYISGTAAVLGHESQAIGDLAGQIEITCDNLERIAAQTLVGTDYQAAEQTLLSGKVYLRHPEHYTEAKALLQRRFPQFADKFIYLRSDICRHDLLVEIELAFIDPIKAT
ncbi:hypothetical protein [Pelagicoccus sp. SDUM812002]|uniref:chorismate transformation enzyme, FkbO/Hyg5 family n=1 Tax=Pelagicoccus sp. SDUM812002 TaxID=3041266 RepID=UPI00280F6285|nr:hypothetical protein [Pelagicoccus sp. SDUM812002]MDQ8186371.1 hypothetical protein [Pelagicoccus sp. SDUM812002]